MGEGENAKEDGVIEDSRMETSTDSKSPNNSRKSLLILIFHALHYRYFLFKYSKVANEKEADLNRIVEATGSEKARNNRKYLKLLKAPMVSQLVVRVVLRKLKQPMKFH